jgi:hypothetical protein
MESHTARLLPDSSPYREYILSLGPESAADEIPLWAVFKYFTVTTLIKVNKILSVVIIT